MILRVVSIGVYLANIGPRPLSLSLFITDHLLLTPFWSGHAFVTAGGKFSPPVSHTDPRHCYPGEAATYSTSTSRLASKEFLFPTNTCLATDISSQHRNIGRQLPHRIDIDIRIKYLYVLRVPVK